MRSDLWSTPELPDAVTWGCEYLHSMLLRDVFHLLQDPHGMMGDYYERSIYHGAVRLAHLCRPTLDERVGVA